MVSKEILPNNYANVINKFSIEWFILADKYELSTTPKVHIITDHLEEYFDITSFSLVETSDQLIENMHQYVHKVMSRINYYVKHVENSNHGKYLYQAVKHINTMNISIRNIKYHNEIIYLWNRKCYDGCIVFVVVGTLLCMALEFNNYLFISISNMEVSRQNLGS